MNQIKMYLYLLYYLTSWKKCISSDVMAVVSVMDGRFWRCLS